MANKVKKCIFAWGLLLFVTSGIAAEGKDFSISVSSYLMNGIVNEYVFDELTTQSKKLESQLDWDISNIPVIGVDFEKYFNKVYIGGNLSVGLPKQSGYMQDYDWLNPYYAKWMNDDPDEVTNYSKHTNNLAQYFDFTITAGWIFDISQYFQVTPVAAYNHNLIYMDGFDGYSKYKNENWEERTFSGKVISYKQVINAFALGCILNSNISRFSITDYFAVSPYITSVDSYDYHWMRSVLFYDMIKSPFKLDEKVSITCRFLDFFKVNLFGATTYIPVSTGKDYAYSINSEGQVYSKGSYSGDEVKGGTARFLWCVGLSLGFEF